VYRKVARFGGISEVIKSFEGAGADVKVGGLPCAGVAIVGGRIAVVASNDCVAVSGTERILGAFPERETGRVCAGVEVPDIETSLGAELGSLFRFLLFSPSNSLIWNYFGNY
jgi:hypothetical protein